MSKGHRASAVPLCLLMLASGWACAQEGKSPAVEEVEAIAKAIGARVNAYESENFIWALGMGRAPPNAIVKTGEKAFKIWKGLSGVKDWKEMWGRRKALIFVGKSRKQYRAFIKHYAKTHAGPYLWDGFESYYKRLRYCSQPVPRVMGAMHLKPADAKGLRNTAAHVIGHLCIQRFKYHNRPLPPWLEEGFATYLEARTLGYTQCYCFTGGYGDTAANTDKLTNLKWNKWKQLIATRARKRADKQIDKILPLRMNQLTAEDIGKSWSIIDFLITRDKGRFISFLRSMKRQWPNVYDGEFSPAKERAQALALKETFDWSWRQLDDEWRAYVRQSYR